MTTIAPPSFSDLQPAIEEIGARLLAALDQLFPPLLNLAQAHCRDVQPYTRAAIVLTTWHALLPFPEGAGSGVKLASTPSHQDTKSPENALLLGSALEMLSVALSVHRLLLLPSNDNTLDKALVGSTILTGDYCFSRAASMAAQTESPYVVELFSSALKQVSEESLRGLFGESADAANQGTLSDDAHGKDAHGEDAILAAAGVRAICHLLQVDAATTETQLRLARLFALRQETELEQALANPQLSPTARAAWSHLCDWHGAGRN